MLPLNDKGEGDRGGTQPCAESGGRFARCLASGCAATPRTRKVRKREKSAEGWRTRFLREVEAVEKIVGLGVALL
jgi:hypothetical protein